jgi:RNA-splicing ligase RtcB
MNGGLTRSTTTPGAYEDVDRVMRAQAELTRIVRRLRPLLSYKGAGP